ncbi:MAG TPA: aldehyde dehydrogenase family protein [Acidobacteriota bacterium]|jgi:acyl-CoA reductase-like NAD-dependent aldehyde dehydrogenase|nr:aldehyde dehydrogenase family protein [Acidobacteriota bacterium]
MAELINSATEELQSRIPHAGANDVDQTAHAAQRAADEGAWSRMTPIEKGKLLHGLAELVEKTQMNSHF